uniref:Transcription factor domain-containing protein n=1 Tax=Bionectria ochroleuca TaxID=29856 RepID=A0A8H7KA88_BIOOC
MQKPRHNMPRSGVCRRFRGIALVHETSRVALEPSSDLHTVPYTSSLASLPPDMVDGAKQRDLSTLKDSSDHPVRSRVSNMDNASSAPSPFSYSQAHEGHSGLGLPGEASLIETLYGLYPSQRDVDAIVGYSAGSVFVTTLFHCHADVAEGKSDPPEAIGTIPFASSRPTLLIKRLLQLAICMQQLSPKFDCSSLSIPDSILRTMEKIVGTVDSFFMSIDRLVTNLEGLECLLLLGYWQQNAGNLRKAWLVFRRALSVGQLIGIDTGKSILQNTLLLSQYPPSPSMLWYRSVTCDRYLSLLLGLPAGSQDNSFAAQAQTARDTPWEKLEKLHTVVSAKLIERNTSSEEQAYRLTLMIRSDLLASAGIMGEEWWEIPIIDPLCSLRSAFQAAGQIILQMNHHLLLILVHIPYMLRRSSPQHDHQSSETICTSSSRKVLERFNAFRQINDSAFACRHVDYAALIAATTLLIAHAQPPPFEPTTDGMSRHRGVDRELVCAVKDRMESLAYLNSDSLFTESSTIIDRLLPILDIAPSASPTSPSIIPPTVELEIPYFGKIKIKVPPSHSNAGQEVEEAQNSLLARMSRSIEAAIISTRPEQPANSVPADRLTEPFISIQFEPESQHSNFIATDVVAGADAWALQGIDATYWALLQNEWRS